jgi:hypothetical protein
VAADLHTHVQSDADETELPVMKPGKMGLRRSPTHGRISRMRSASTELVWILFALVAVLVPGYLARPAPTYAATSVSADVFGSAGGDAQGASHSVGDSFGQFPIGLEPSADGTEVRDGFWATLPVRAPDTTPPELSVSIFQNPYVTEHLDIYLIASEAVTDSSITVDVGTTHVPMEENNAEEHIWRCDYDLCCTGTLSIKAWARDLSLNRGSLTRTFSSSMVLASMGGLAASPDSRLEVRFLPGVVKKDAYVLVFGSAEDRSAGDVLYVVSPTGIEIDGFVEIAMAYPVNETEPEHLAIGVMDGESLVPLDSYLERDRGLLLTYSDRLGTYGLVSVPDRTTPTYGGAAFRVSQNAPNPFVNSTTLAFEASREGHVAVELLSIDGRAVRTLLDTYITPGKHTAEWDGCDDTGKQVAPGLYLCRVRFGEDTITRKVVHLH